MHLLTSLIVLQDILFAIVRMDSLAARADAIELHHDVVADEALGGQSRDLGKRYFMSQGFIGTVVVSIASEV